MDAFQTSDTSTITERDPRIRTGAASLETPIVVPNDPVNHTKNQQNSQPNFFPKFTQGQSRQGPALVNNDHWSWSQPEAIGWVWYAFHVHATIFLTI